MIRILSCVLILLLHFNGFSQKRFFSEKSNITFFSEGVIEDIKATNTKVTSILDLQSGEVAYLLSPKDFQFEKKLMQVHFNEKYMESEKFPRSTFKGKIEGLNATSTGLAASQGSWPIKYSRRHSGCYHSWDASDRRQHSDLEGKFYGQTDRL